MAQVCLPNSSESSISWFMFSDQSGGDSVCCAYVAGAWGLAQPVKKNKSLISTWVTYKKTQFVWQAMRGTEAMRMCEPNQCHLHHVPHAPLYPLRRPYYRFITQVELYVVCAMESKNKEDTGLRAEDINTWGGTQTEFGLSIYRECFP